MSADQCFQYPAAIPPAQHPALTMLRRVLDAYPGHERDDYRGRQCDFCGVTIDNRSDFDAVVNHEPGCTLMAAWALVHRLEKAEVPA